MRIGQLAEHLGINPRTIRYYERIGLLPEPERTDAGYRSYGERDAERVVFIKKAQRLGLALSEIKEIIVIRDRDEQPCGYVLELIKREVTELDSRIADLVQLREHLVQLQVQPPPTTASEATFCDLIEHFPLETTSG